MANQELVDYIKASTAQGHKIEDIKATLVQQGWSAQDIDDAVSATSPKADSPPAASPTATPHKSSGHKKLIIVVVLLAIAIPVIGFLGIGFLAYNNVLAPDTLLPEKCSWPTTITCLDHTITSTSVVMNIQNGAGRDMTISNFEVTDSDGSSCSSTRNISINNNAQASLEATGCNFQADGDRMLRFKGVITYSWLDTPNINHELKGEIFAPIQ